MPSCQATWPGTEHMTFDRHALVERGPQPQDAQRSRHCAGARRGRRRVERHVDHDARALVIDAHQRGATGIGLARQAAGELDDVRDAGRRP